MIKIGLLGFGTVGQAVYTILTERKNIIEEEIQDNFVVEKILVKNPEKHQNINSLITTNIKDITQDSNINLIIELTGAVDEIVDEIKACLLSRKSVITANKALVSKYYEDLLEASKKGKSKLKFEAAVAGAIPIISQTKNIALLNDVSEIIGVLNGTCNYILNQMENSLSYEEALKKAQELGYAEADPSADVDGLDTRRKLRILSSLIYQKPIKEEDIFLEGITKLTIDHLKQAKIKNKRYKLVARATKNGDYSVKPELVDEGSILGGLVDGENAIIIKTSNAKELIFKGMGAGGRETAFSVLSDFLNLFNC